MINDLRLTRALLNLSERGIDAIRENDTIYVLIGDNQLELSEFEIEFQEKDWLERGEELNSYDEAV